MYRQGFGSGSALDPYFEFLDPNVYQGLHIFFLTYLC